MEEKKELENVEVNEEKVQEELARKKKMTLIKVGVGGLIAIGGIFIMLSGKKHKTTEPYRPTTTTSISYETSKHTESNEIGEKPVVEKIEEEENKEMTEEEIDAYVNSSSFIAAINQCEDINQIMQFVDELETQYGVEFDDKIEQTLISIANTLRMQNSASTFEDKQSWISYGSFDGLVSNFVEQYKYHEGYDFSSSKVTYLSSEFEAYDTNYNKTYFELTKMPNEFSELLKFHKYYDEKGIATTSSMHDVDVALKYYAMYADKAFRLAISDAEGKYTADDFGFKQIENTIDYGTTDFGYHEAESPTEEGEWIEYDDIATGEHVKEFVPYGR